jgi:LacI family transcriptional regulator
LIDVAESVGVSKATVSRALRGHPDISEETRAKVVDAARRMSYVPFVGGRALRTGRFTSIGLVVPIGAWTWFGELQRGVAEEVSRLGYTLVVHALPPQNGAEQDFVERVMPSMPIDGLVVLMADGMLPLIGDLSRRGLPIVLIDDRRDGHDFPTISVDNRGGSELLTRHLLGLGRRRIAFAGGATKDAFTRLRLDGYRAALAEEGVRVDQRLIAVGDEQEWDAHRSLAALGEAGAGFDAVVACYDELAFEMIRELQRVGVRVPDDVAVVGFDDIPPARLLSPALTTMRQPFYEIGAAASRTIHSALHEEIEAPSVQLPTELVVRESCGAKLARERRS